MFLEENILKECVTMCLTININQRGVGIYIYTTGKKAGEPNLQRFSLLYNL